MKVSENIQNNWEIYKKIYAKAVLKAQYLGNFLLEKQNPLLCQMYLIHQKPKYQKKKKLRWNKVRCSSSLKHARRCKER